MAQWWEALELQRMPAAEFPGGPGSSLLASKLGLKLWSNVESRTLHEKVVLFLHRSWPRSAFCLRSDCLCLDQFDQLVSYGHWSLWYIITSLLHIVVYYYIINTSLWYHYYIIIYTIITSLLQEEFSLLHHYYILLHHYYVLLLAHYYPLLQFHYYPLLRIITSLLRHYYVIMLRACSM